MMHTPDTAHTHADGRVDEDLDLIIIGAGFSGIGAAFRISQRNPGIRYRILERRERIGGTWDLFRYPGVRSDSSIFALSFPWEPWRREEEVADGADIRDYLENWYRPNLRVKNRDGGTVIGPWLVSASEIPDPQALGLRTYVNGQVTQQGHTRQMIHSVASLIEYLSDFMTLRAGDVILTGTPDGVVNVQPGDEVVCEIDQVGRLVNTLAADSVYGR